LVIYNGEDIAPVWDPIASTINNGYTNPETDGINSSTYCVAIMRNKSTDNGGQPWSGGALWNAYKVNVDPAIYNKFTLMVLKNVAGDVQLEIQSTDGVKDYIKVAYLANALGQWQELTFTNPSFEDCNNKQHTGCTACAGYIRGCQLHTSNDVLG